MARFAATALGLGLVETIDLAVDEAQEGAIWPSTRRSRLVPVPPRNRDLVTYKRLREEVLKHRSSVGFVPKMIRQHGIVESLERMAVKGIDGLRFLIDQDRLDLAVERWIADPRFSHLFRPEVVKKAKLALREAPLLIDARKQGEASR
ncbi:hypothetical protein [Mesorhizobium sp. M1378]|uniref:hypothetical protein n=1 Tax=Mesorhizobium sp. M1378 TaxID=2957092 RepID=UPI00333BB7DE